MIMNNFELVNHNGVIFQRAGNLSAKHGFSTRRGGLSVLPHTAELNLAFGRGDDEQTVIANLNIFCQALRIEPETVVSARQIHSAEVAQVGPDDRGLGRFALDGFVANQPGIALCIKTADCVPILLCDEEHGVIGACHAGWRGTAAGIACKTVEEMCRIGAQPKAIQAAIGPCIHNCCYEVSLDFYDEVERLCGRTFANRYITPYPARAEKAPRELILNPPDRTESPKYRADLVGMNLHMLRSVGMAEAHINICAACTCCQSTLYFSHRATGGKRGTMAAIISL